MGVALQAGVLAGGVVFVPMALAGWHLTRNRVLFFSAALFIVLAVSVHLLPYFPSMSSVIYSMHSPWPYLTVVNSVPPLVTPPVNCLLHVHDLVWEDMGSDRLPDDFMNGQSSREFYWSRTGNAAGVCRYEKLKSQDMVDLFRGTWIVIAGDSQLRLFFVSLLDLLMPNANPARINVPQKRSSYEYVWEEENIKFQFKWTPFTANLTNLIVDYRRNMTYPDVLIMNGGLWHMLYHGNSTRYGQGLSKLRNALLSLFPPNSYSESQSVGKMGSYSRENLQVPHMFWLNLPTLVTSWLNTETKRAKMSPDRCGQYDEALMDSNLVHPRGPLTLIDLKKISRGCGYRCTVDGMHYNNATYEAAVHVMVNTLLIATQQAPAA
ncbi:unnamed protein product [Calypogeia fissa]